MSAFSASTRCRKSPPAWHADFEALLPKIEFDARLAFRHLKAEARDEAIQSVVCSACAAFARLVELGKTDLAYPSALARYGIAQFKIGRQFGCRLNLNDLSSEYCQQRTGVMLKRLDSYDAMEECWEQLLVEDRHAGPAEVAASRIDFSSWLALLPRRLRRISNFLASGETTSATAKRFRLSRGRISQIRRQLFEAWCRFQGEDPAWAAV